MQLAQEQENALQEMLSGKNVFLTGEAGTGKSTIVKEFKRRINKNCVFLAPTGIAAVNIGGSTIHSFMCFAPGPMNEETIGTVSNKHRKALIRNAEIIVIDEISMVRGDLFWAIDHRLRQIATNGDKKKPFGGKQIILVGDFFQLPPVVKSEEEERVLIETFGGIFAFQTKTWDMANFKCCCLKTIHRQSNDALFLSILNHIRHNEIALRDLHDAADGVLLNVKEMLNKHANISIPLAVPPVCLCTTNREANILNSLTNERSEGDCQTFSAIVKGVFNEKDFPTPAKLELKKGARVMTLINRRAPSGVLEFVNGDVGEVVGFLKQAGEQLIQIKLDNGKIVNISPNEWKNYAYELKIDAKTGKEMIVQKEVGAFIQFPLKLAYAMTIHKSQGMSVDAALIKLGNGCFAHGQLYTALSRCRSLKNLRIDREIYDEDIIVNPAVVDFYNAFEDVQPKATTVNIEVPEEYQDAVQEFLRSLMGGSRSATTITSSPQPLKISNHAMIRNLIVVYKKQTTEEQASLTAKKKNGRGFNKIDSPILTPIAEKYLSLGYITHNELDTVCRLLPKYHRQYE